MKKKFLPLDLQIVRMNEEDVLASVLSSESTQTATYGSEGTDDFGFDFWE